MAQVEIVIPQMGEGLHEVILLGFQKRPGDTIQRDEPLYSMETDKAVMEVESPHSGVLTAWLAREGEVIPIGAPIARIETADTDDAPDFATTGSGSNGTAHTTVDNAKVTDVTVVIPPRSRAYCRELGIAEEEMRTIPAPSGKLLPADIDVYMKSRLAPPTLPMPPLSRVLPYNEKPLTPQQRTFLYRLKRSQQMVVPATAKRSVEWGGLRAVAQRLRLEGEIQPSTFQTFAYCVVQAVCEHPRFRSALIGETTIREYAHVNVGIAVGMPEGELTIAVVPEADKLDFGSFVEQAQTNIRRAREGEDQVTENTQLLLTYMGPYEILDAVPVLVAPAAAVLFIGSPYEQNGQTLANLSLTFDHRLIQGIEAAEFMKTIVDKVAHLEAMLPKGVIPRD